MHPSVIEISFETIESDFVNFGASLFSRAFLVFLMSFESLNFASKLLKRNFISKLYKAKDELMITMFGEMEHQKFRVLCDKAPTHLDVSSCWQCRLLVNLKLDLEGMIHVRNHQHSCCSAMLNFVKLFFHSVLIKLTSRCHRAFFNKSLACGMSKSLMQMLASSIFESTCLRFMSPP